MEKAHHNGKLGIIAGGGFLPRLIIDELKPTREIFVIALESECDSGTVDSAAHEWINIAAAGKTIKILKEQNVSEVVLAGSIKRPPLSSLRPDFEGVKLLGRIMALHNQGDNAILSAIMEYLESQGFRVVGAHELLKNLLIGEGSLGKIKPDKHAVSDIALACEVLHATGKVDIGQAVIVQKGRVIGIEAAEGTDELIKRCAPYLQGEEGGVLVKMRKTGQDSRADLPSVGVSTAENIAGAGLSGIAVEAGSALVIDKEKVIESANRLGIFILGIPPQ